MRRRWPRGILFPAAVFSLNVTALLTFFFWPSLIRTRIEIEPTFEAGWRLPDQPVKIVTFNIGFGKRLDEAIELLRSEDPDIVCLQEIPKDQVTIVEAALGMRGCWEPSTNQSDDAGYGKALLTRGGLSEPQSLPNPHGGSFGVWAAVTLHGGRFLAGSIHLRDLKAPAGGYPSREREIRALHEAVEKVGAPALFAGDFNNPHVSVNYDLITKRLNDLGKESGPTHASRLPLLRIDYVFGTAEWESVSAKSIKTRISDHYPVVVVVRAAGTTRGDPGSEKPE